MLSFDTLALPNGNTLINVPCDEQALINLGFSATQAAEHCTQARAEYQWRQIRTQRNALLAHCDWTQMPDAPLTAEQKDQWKTYRQALRDLPKTAADLDSVVWPLPPA